MLSIQLGPIMESLYKEPIDLGWAMHGVEGKAVVLPWERFLFFGSVECGVGGIIGVYDYDSGEVCMYILHGIEIGKGIRKGEFSKKRKWIENYGRSFLYPPLFPFPFLHECKY